MIDGTTTKDLSNNSFALVDLPTVRLLIRSLIENYLTINYLFLSPKTNVEGEFRFYLYQLSGLSARQKYPATTEEHLEQKSNEKVRIDEFIKLIKENKYFQELTNKEQSNILGRKSAREYGWEKMIEHSDLVSEPFIQMWKLFSNSAHSELIGAIQFRDYILNPKDANNAICIEIFLVIQLTSSLISNFETHYPTTKKIFNTEISREFKEDIDVWTALARENNVS